MKGKSHPANDHSLNPSQAPDIGAVIAQVDESRRRFVQGSASAAMLAASGLSLSGVVNAMHGGAGDARNGRPGIGFASIAPSLAPVADAVRVPPGYNVELLVAWGDPIMPGGQPFRGDAGETAADQEKQYGAHTDFMCFLPFTARGRTSSERGVLVANNEYTHEEILYPDGQIGAGYSIQKCRKSQAAHGMSVLELQRIGGRWMPLRTSPLGRRITANTPMLMSGPAAGHALLRTRQYDIQPDGSFDADMAGDGRLVFGTLNNCGGGVTPWGTVLSGEENWNGYFGSSSGSVPGPASGETGKLYNRYGVSASGAGYRWHTVDPRFDLAQNPNEPNTFGWVVEIDPFDPKSVPVKRTALGRFKHESAQYITDRRNDIAFYMGDDERNEYIYKFVCAGKYHPGQRAANRHLLDHGILYVARFSSTPGKSGSLRGEWLPLQPGTLGVDGVALRDNPNFAGADDAEVQAKILIKTRMAADAVGATMMDRPEWTAARPRQHGHDRVEIYCTLTNNNRRGTAAAPTGNKPDGSTTAGSSRPAVDAANPRANNLYGHIIRWREDGDSVRATGFDWDIFVQCGDTRTARTPAEQYTGNISDNPDGSVDFGAPDGLWFDPYGRLWVQTDQQGDGMGDWANIGANVMCAADPVTREIRRFLTGPRNCEVTGVTMTPDGRTMFVGIQHPGEESTAANPTEFSNWPASQWSRRADGSPIVGGRPRSGVVVITKRDGGVIGS